MARVKYLALDIDGTLTDQNHIIPTEIITSLRRLAHAGWRVVLVTGRSFTFAAKTVSQFDFPHYLSLQNGSIMFSMPERKVLFKSYLDSSALLAISSAVDGLPGDLVVYGGYEKQDSCFWRPTHFTGDLELYMQEVSSREGNKWFPVSDFKDIWQAPLVKYPGLLRHTLAAQANLLVDHSVECTVIKDPFFEDYYFLLATAAGTNKGSALQKLIAYIGGDSFVVGAGNDLNDISLLAASDYKVAMAGSPERLLQMADDVAPAPDCGGLLSVLERLLLT